jgi:ASC-1-like (ASCH) protein
VGYRNITHLQAGDRLLLNGRHPYLIQRLGRYASFEELPSREEPASIAPDMTASELLAALRATYPADKESLGAVALEMRPE